jgi:hypothetical protein
MHKIAKDLQQSHAEVLNPQLPATMTNKKGWA